jgi:hypothetical protein
MTQGAVVSRSSFRDRLIGALRLNPDTYAEVASDDAATGQAAVIITVAGILVVVQSALSASSQVSDALFRSMIVVFVAVLGIIVLWLLTILYAGLLAVVATMGIRGPQTRTAFWRRLRALGFASATSAFRLLELIPTLGDVIGIAITLWTFVASIMAIWKALGETTGRAIAIIIGAWIIVALVAIPLLIVIFAVRGK